MAGYSTFARFYDALTENVNYPARAGYFHRLIQKYGNGGPLLLDLACGTGRLTRALGALGYDPIGVDGSPEMLSCAMAAGGERLPLFLCQDMAELDLYGTVDAAVCALDSLNHLTEHSQVQQTIERVALFLNPGGLFLFDVNTRYKQEQVLADNVFVFEQDTFFCVWQNHWQAPDTTQVQLDFFMRKGGLYRRESECFSEKVYDTPFLQDCIGRAGLTQVALLGDDTMESPGSQTQRLIFVCKK